MSTLAKIPCTIVTGFLGAGKTTLVRHLLENAGGRRLAVLVNEFGDLGFDGSFLAGCGITGCSEDDIVELPNGCLCCTVADDFVPALEKLLGRAEPAGPHPDRDLGARPAEAARRRLQLAGHPLPRHGRRRHRRRRRPGGRRRRLRRRSGRRSRPSAPPTRRSTTTIRLRRCSRTSSCAPT